MEGLLDLWGLPNFFVGLISAALSTSLGIWIGVDYERRRARFEKLIDGIRLRDIALHVKPGNVAFLVARLVHHYGEDRNLDYLRAGRRQVELGRKLRQHVLDEDAPEPSYRECTREDREYIVKTLKGFGAGCLDCGKRVTPDNLHSWDADYEQVTDRNNRARTALANTDGGWSQAAKDVLQERREQVTREGWTPEHDDKHGKGEMANAAAVYAHVATLSEGLLSSVVEDPVRGRADIVVARRLWPWAVDWFKPKDRRSNLVRAGALIIAEIERLDRPTPPTEAE